uniref:E3 SUMO-protein ligase PIAS2 n=1 Tax=Glossina morsitans morsitans TaxID=37546 RepID=A0A1B0FRA7_GLOMM
MASYAAKIIGATFTERDFKLSVALGLPSCNFISNSTHMLLDAPYCTDSSEGEGFDITRSQTQAENALLASSRSGAASLTSNQVKQQHMNSNSTQKRSQSAAVAPNFVDPNAYKECEDMLNILRVVELQKILSFMNISFAGRKIDYQRRILTLLRTNFDLISHKIREVYAQSLVEQQQATLYGPPDPKRMYSQMQMQPNPGNLVAAAAANAQMPGGAQQILNPAAATGMPPTVPPGNNVVPFMHAIPTQMPIHPDVRLKKLAFYDVLGTLIKPSSLVPRNAQRMQEVPFYFTLTPQQATEIASNRDIRNSSKVEHAIQVQLRFCLLETSCDQDDCFPPSVAVKVNNKMCQLPNALPQTRPNMEPKRPPRPINVTSNVKLSPTVTNTITVQWSPDYTRGYCIAVYLVKKLTSAQLLTRLKTKGVKPADYTRALKKLREDADCEIATTMLKVSLNCPLGKMKMSIPCRASTCSHLQCFDANLYLQMNERKPTWNCPVCDKPAAFDNLLDYLCCCSYFQEVLASNLLKSDDTEIQLHKDGSWSTHSLRADSQILDTPTKPVEKVEVISDDIGDALAEKERKKLITTEDVKPIKAAAVSVTVTSNELPSSTTNSETVDLTLSDSDDDDTPLAKRRPACKISTSSATSSTVSTSNINGNSAIAGQHRGVYVQQKTDFVVRQLWLPSLKVLSFLCNLLTHYTVKVNKKFLTHQAPFIDDWMRTEAFYLVRFIWALVVFIFMLDTTGVIETLQENLIKKKIKWCIDDDINFDDNLSVGETALVENLSKDDISSQSSDGENAGTNSVPFDFNELPYVAQEDIASSTHAAAGVRRRRKMSHADLTIICLDSPSPPSTPVRSPKIDVSSMNDFKVYQNKDANKFLENPPSCER